MNTLETKYASFILYEGSSLTKPKLRKSEVFLYDFRYWLSRSDMVAMIADNPVEDKRNLRRYFKEPKSGALRRFLFDEAKRYDKVLVNPSLSHKHSAYHNKVSLPVERVIDRMVVGLNTAKEPDHSVLFNFPDLTFAAKLNLVAKTEMEKLKLKPRILVPFTYSDKTVDYLEDVEKTQLALALIQECGKRYAGTKKFLGLFDLNTTLKYYYSRTWEKWQVEESSIDPFSIITRKF